ncbi:mediator complex subunit Med5 [Xylariaceae sp. FL0255]|nr:mediator complex subunit Med5 [Xylariaceae sp. FL0255]
MQSKMDTNMNMDIDSKSNPRSEWAAFLSRCLRTRMDTNTFDTEVADFSPKHPVKPAVVADVFLQPQPTNHEALDPRVPRYLQVLIQQKLVDTPSILESLHRYSSSHIYTPVEDETHVRWTNSYAAEEIIFYRLAKNGIASVREALLVCGHMARWMNLFTAAFTAVALGHIQNTHTREEMEAARAAFVMLLLRVSENKYVLDSLSRAPSKVMRQALSDSLASFNPSILGNSTEITDRLELFRTGTLASFEKEGPNNGIDDIEPSIAIDNIAIPDMPTINSRAGLYIYLNAALVGRPLIDDAVLFSYLQQRYQGDVQTTTVDLILASFDVLANAVFRNEGQKTGHLLRSYLINKLPLLLATLGSSMFAPLTPQFCITQALAQVDTNAFPTLSAMFDDNNNNNMFTDSVRQDFCFACCLHELIPESSIEGLLGEITYQSLPQGGRYDKDKLVDECMADPERIQVLVSELDNMDGNVGAVCQALIEVINRLCANRETMTLKLLCSQLAKKPLSLDVMLLFGQPAAILQPLCEVLDNWQYDEDQGEYQPIYEEFGAVILLLLAFVFRYDLSTVDLGIRTPDSFVAKLLNQRQFSRPVEELTEQENRHLDGWITGLFDTDTEAKGLGDELLASCPPQDFYLLVPTLFQQTTLAYDSKYLDDEGLKTGIEYLVDTFLLPSLIMAITYVSHEIWTESKPQADPKDSKPPEKKAVIVILQMILLVKQGSDEAQAMLSAVTNIVAKPLEQALRLYQRQDPKCQDIEPLLNAIKDNIRLSRRTAGAGHNELEAWTGTAGGGLAASVRHTMQTLLSWSLHPAINVMPTSYTHRQMLAAHKLLGERRLLHVILEEVKQQTDAGSGSIIYDIAIALICAPDVTNVPPPVMTLLVDPVNPPVNPQRQMSLREALKDEAEDFKSIHKSDPSLAEHVIRLHRRVEAQLVVHQPAAEAMLQGDLALGLDEDAAAALAAAQGDGLVAGDPSLNLGLGNTSGDLGLSAGDMGLGTGAESSVGLDFGSADDLFNDLSKAAGDDLLEGWDGMDMS